MERTNDEQQEAAHPVEDPVQRSANSSVMKTKLFVDEKGVPMKFCMPPKPSSYHAIIKRNGGSIVANCADEVICLAPPGWIVPANAICDYYAYEYISACTAEGRIVDKAPFLVPRGSVAPNPADGLSNEAKKSVSISETQEGNSDKTGVSQHSRGRNRFSIAEDLSILHFAYDGNFQSVTNKPRISNKAWNDAASRGVFGCHSGDTARTRFQKIILPEIGLYQSLYEKHWDEVKNDILPSSAGEPHQIAAGSLASNSDESCLPSQSQLGPMIDSQAANQPLLTSTPCVQPTTNAPKSADAIPAFHADVVGVVPVVSEEEDDEEEEEDEEDSDGSSAYTSPDSEPEVVAVRRKSNQFDGEEPASPTKRKKISTSAASTPNNNNASPGKKQPAVIESPPMSPRNKNKKAEETPNEKKITRSSKLKSPLNGSANSSQNASMNVSQNGDAFESSEEGQGDSAAKHPILAVFVSNPDHLDDEFTQTCTVTRNRRRLLSSQSASSLSALSPPRAIAASDKKSSQDQPKVTQSAVTHDAAVTSTVVRPDESSHTTTISTGTANKELPQPQAEAIFSSSNKSQSNATAPLPASSVADTVQQSPEKDVKESLPYKLVKALAERYGIDPLQIIYILHQCKGSFSDAIRFIEEKPPASKDSSDKTGVPSTSEEVASVVPTDKKAAKGSRTSSRCCASSEKENC